MAKREVIFTDKQLAELVGLYTQSLTDGEVAAYFGISEKALKRFLKRRENAELRQRIEAQKVAAKARMRRALYDKGVGRQFTEGKATVIDRDGKVIEQGTPAVAAAPGDLNAIKFWLMNCDDTKEWRDAKQTLVGGVTDKPLMMQIQNMNKLELINYIVEGIKDGLIPQDKLIPQITDDEECRIVDADFKIEPQSNG